MKASEVLRRYTAGERDFRRANLRGQFFRGQDLSGADFSETDIRGANFTDAILEDANFTKATAGLQKRWVIIQWLLVGLLAGLSGCLQGYLSYWITDFFPRFWEPNYDWSRFNFDVAITASNFIVLITTFVAVICQGFTARAVATIGFAVAGIVAVAIAVAGTVIVAVATASGFTIVNVAFAVAGAGAAAGTVGFAVAVVGALAATGTVGFAVAFAVGVTFAGAAAGTVGFAVAVASTSILLGIHCSRRARKGDEKFALIRSFGIAFAALGGTSFCGATLTRARFTQATLESTHFHPSRQQPTRMTQVCWHQATQLERARLGGSILANPQVCQLLVTRNGYHQSYVGANLEGANLHGANLNHAMLTRANLSGATLEGANLKDAILREVLATGTNFAYAYLTGACIEAWNLDHTTRLDHVDCQYVFLLEHPNALGHRDRRPHEPDRVFAKGDFEQLYKKMVNIVQVLLRDGMKNPVAFREAFQDLINQHPEINHDSILSVERKGNDAAVTLEVPETADKANISRNLWQSYEEKVRQLEAKVETLHQLRAADLKEVALAQKAQFFNQLVGGNAMNENSNQSRNIQVGGDLNATGSTFNLGELSGNVTNSINQLPTSPNLEPAGIKELLTQLQVAIEADTDLPEKGKAIALEQIKTLAEVAQNPEQSEKQGLGTQAITFFKNAVSFLPDTAKLAEACSKLLPLITKALGLPL